MVAKNNGWVQLLCVLGLVAEDGALRAKTSVEQSRDVRHCSSLHVISAYTARDNIEQKQPFIFEKFPFGRSYLYVDAAPCKAAPGAFQSTQAVAPRSAANSLRTNLLRRLQRCEATPAMLSLALCLNAFEICQTTRCVSQSCPHAPFFASKATVSLTVPLLH